MPCSQQTSSFPSLAPQSFSHATPLHGAARAGPHLLVTVAMGNIQQNFETQLQQLKSAIASDQSAHAIAKTFVQGINGSSDGSGPRFDEHDYALCSRALAQCIFDFYGACLQRGGQSNWFVPRLAFAGQPGSEGETELGVVFAVCARTLRLLAGHFQTVGCSGHVMPARSSWAPALLTSPAL